MTGHPWGVGAATGIGSLPGADIVESVTMVFGELPDFPFLPELPARGPGADMIGRTAGLLVDLPVELYVARWQVASRPGSDLRRTKDLWERDLDALTAAGDGCTGPVKVQAAGPLTLAASLYRAQGGQMLADPGAVRDLAASLADGLRAHVADVSTRLPGATVVVQLDEPSLPVVLAGRVPTESGFSTLRAVEPSTATALLRSIVDTAGAPIIVHCCASEVPLRLLRDAGAAAVAIDLDLVDDLDALGEILDGGLGLLAGALSTSEAHPSGADAASRISRLWRDIGLPDADLRTQVVVTPACGLAGSSPDHARAAITAAREAAHRLANPD